MGSTPNWSYSYVPTAAEWNLWWGKKQDELGFTPLNAAGGSMSGKLTTFGSSAAQAGLRVFPGTAPTTPLDGDIWLTALGLFIRAGGITTGPLFGPGNITANDIAYNAYTFATVKDALDALNSNNPFNVSRGGTGSNTAYGAKDNISVKSTDLSAAATVNLATSTGDLVHITGSATISSFGTMTAGVMRDIVFDSAGSVVTNSANIIIPGGASITVGAADTMRLRSEGSGIWRVMDYTSASAANIQYGTLVTASGTAVDFTNIPAWVRRITIMFDTLSTNGTSLVLLRIGDSGGITTTGYVGGVGNVLAASAAAALNTTGFQFPSASASATRSGLITLQKMTLVSNATWFASGTVVDTNGTVIGTISGSKTLGSDLDRLRLTMANGTDTFDGGGVNITWER